MSQLVLLLFLGLMGHQISIFSIFFHHKKYMSADSTVQNPSLCEYISAPIRFCVFGKHVELARAILKDTPIILLDEPSSALDVYSEKKIHQALGKLMKEKIVIMVSHRRDAYDKFDHVIKIE